jgi:TonB family protein
MNWTCRRLSVVFCVGYLACCGAAQAALPDQSPAAQQSVQEATRHNADGLLRVASQDFDGAIADYSEAIRLDPLFADAYYNRALAKGIKQDFDGAIKDFLTTIAIDPKNSRAFFNLGRLRASRDDFVGAIADFSQSLALNPNDAATYVERGRAERRHREPNAASIDFERARALDARLRPGGPQPSLARAGRYRMGNGVTTPKVVREVKPRYTADAMVARVQGSVLVECVVDVDGTVSDARVAQPLDPVLDIQALNAARQWQFEPGTKDGSPVPVIVVLELTFTMR